MERSAKPKSKSFVISTADSRYVKYLLQQIIETNANKGWKETLSKEKYDLKWVSASTEDEECNSMSEYLLVMKILMQENSLVNRFPGVQGLVHKDTFISAMSIGLHLDKDLFSFVPPQFTFPKDGESFKEYQKTQGNCIYIAKPVASSEGNSIVLFKSLTELPTQLGQEMVVQKYISDPLLVDGFKLDLRIYVFITRSNPIQAFICDEGLARFCTVPYEKPTKENFKNFFMHLTNYSINKHHEGYVESDDILRPNNATKRTLTYLYLTLQQKGIDTEIIKANIKSTCEKTMAIYGPFFEHAVTTITNGKQTPGNFFQVLGFDLLIDSELNAHLLEINDHPSLNIFLEKDFMGGGQGKSLSQIDLYVKQRVITDAIKLAKKSTAQISQTDNFRSLSRIYPSTDPSTLNTCQTMLDLKALYYKIAPVKSKLSISSSNFEKLWNYSSTLQESELSKVDLNLLFQKQTQGLKAIEFMQFSWLIESLKSKIGGKDESIISKANSFQQEKSHLTSLSGNDVRKLSKSLEKESQNSQDQALISQNALNWGLIESESDIEPNFSIYERTQQLEQSKSQENMSKYLLGDSKLDYLFNNGDQQGKLQSKKNSNGTCPTGSFVNDKDNCQSCNTWCNRCTGIAKCSECEQNTTLIAGGSFGFCFPSCPLGYFIQSLYTDDDLFFDKAKCDKRTTSFSLAIMISQCEMCPWGCGTCEYSLKKWKSICSSCLRGFSLNQTSGLCEVTPCKEGNCSTAINCTTCQDGFAIFTKSRQTNRGCIQCSENCQRCNITATINRTQCQQCLPNYFLNSTGACELNRTCNRDQWFNDTSLSCQSCPSGCLTCKQGSTNGTVACQSCRNETVFNSTTQICQDRCNFTTVVFDWIKYQCTQCPNTTFPNITAGRCDQCPNYCPTCYWNRTLNRTECSTCTNDSFFENSTRRCRVNCSQTQFFDYNRSLCVSCPTGQFMNLTTTQCQSCPANCTSCVFNQTALRVECQSCITNQTIDLSTRRCRRSCDSSLFFNWTSNACQNCSNGTVINETTETCQACPRGCRACFNNKTTGRVECSSCDSNLVIDNLEKRCRIQCQTGTTFFWETQTCRVCEPYKYYNSKNKTCDACPTACPSCYVSGTKLFCSECNATTVLDWQRNQCKLNCKGETLFNWNTFTCEPCPSGRFLDDFSKACKSCTSNCTKCKQLNWYSLDNHCTVCNEGFVVDVTTKKCIPTCPTNQRWLTSSKQCFACAAGTFYNSTSQTCINCPSNCSACVQNTTSGLVECTVCRTGVFDQELKQCRPSCNSTQFFNRTSSLCQNCNTDSFYNTTSLQCQSCPTNCESCFFQSTTNRPECRTCNNSWVLDAYFKQCRPQCPTNQAYSFELQQCRSCPTGQYLSSSNQCISCPTHCTSCQLVNRVLQCTNCTSNAFIDTSRQLCRINCNDTAVYNWTSNTCVNCNSDEFFNTTSSSCQACPTNCATCFFNSQTRTSQCTSCRTNFVLDNDRALCRPQCNSSSFFDWTTNSCRQCPSGTFLNGAQQCQSCPNGCSACSRTTETGSTQCSACQSGFILDSSRNLCRQICNSTQVYSWDSASCVTCTATQFANQTSQTCQSCPTNCTGCAYNTSSNIVQCNDCTSGSVIDSSTNQCRINCPSTQTWNSTARQCQNCPTGTWINTETQTCQSCPLSCSACSRNSSNLPECQTCLSGFVLDTTARRCRKTCNSNQFFDWALFDCANCSSNCLTCTSSSQCSSCAESFNLTNGSCVFACTSSQTWNSTTKRCVESVTASLRLTASNSTMVRCRAYTINAGSYSGFTNLVVSSVKWSYVVNLGDNFSWRSEMNNIVNEAQKNNAQSLTIPISITEQITSQTNITFTAEITSSNGQSATNSTMVAIYPFQQTTIGGFNSPYINVNGSNAFTFPMTATYPQCQNPGPFSIPPAPTGMSCSLFRADNSVLVTSLANCTTIAAGVMTNGINYFISYTYRTTPINLLATVSGQIQIQTLVIRPTCSINQGSTITINQNSQLVISASITNQKSTLIYRLQCSPQSTSGICGIQQVTQNSPDFTLATSDFAAGQTYDFTLSILENSVSQSTCATQVRIIAVNTALAASMRLFGLSSTQSVESSSEIVNSDTVANVTKTTDSSSTSEVFIDRGINNNIICNNIGNQSDKNITIEFNQIVDGVRQALHNLYTGISTSGNTLRISRNTLRKDSVFELVCISVNGNKTEKITQILTTQDSNLFNFTIEPAIGTEKVTQFRFTVQKEKGQELWCRFGYKLAGNIEYLFKDQSSVFSNKYQVYMTTLKKKNGRLDTGSQMMAAECLNAQGLKHFAYFNITVKKGSNDIIDKIIEPIAEWLSILRFQSFQRTTFADIQTAFDLYNQELMNELPSQEKKDFQISILSQVESIASNITSEQMQEVLKIITDVWNGIKTNYQPNEDSLAVIQTVKTIKAILSEEITAISIIKVIDVDHYFAFLSIINEILNSYSYALNSDPNLIASIMKAIEQGAGRASGNLLPDEQQFEIQGDHFVVQIQKISRQSKRFQHQFLIKLTNIWDQIEGNDQDGFSISIPQNLVLSQYDYVIITCIVFRQGLSDVALSKQLMSDSLQIMTYYANFPVSLNNRYDLSPIVVKELADPIIIAIPYKQAAADQEINEAKCSYYNEEIKLWSQLECDTKQHSTVFDEVYVDSNFVICCTPHLTTFALVYDNYFTELMQQAFRQILYSTIPPAIIYLLLGISIIMTLYQARKLRIKLEKKQKVQTNKQVVVDSESPYKPKQEVSNNSDISNPIIVHPFKPLLNENTQQDHLSSSQVILNMKNEAKTSTQRDNDNNQTQNDSSPSQTFQEVNQNDVNQDATHRPIQNNENIEISLEKKKTPSSEFCQFVKESSKIYRILFEQLQDPNEAFKVIFSKIMLINILLLSFTTTIIITANVILLSNFHQSSKFEIMVIGSYVILLMLSILFKQLETVVKNSLMIKHIWLALHLIFAFVQPIFITQIADNLSKEEFLEWVKASCIILTISCTFEDLILVPCYLKASKFIQTRFKL